MKTWTANDILQEDHIDHSGVTHCKLQTRSVQDDIELDVDNWSAILEFLNVRQDALDNATQLSQTDQTIVIPGRKNNKVWNSGDMSDFPQSESFMAPPLDDPKRFDPGVVRPPSPVLYHNSEHSTGHFKGNVPKAMPQQNQFVTGGGMHTSTIADQTAFSQDFQGEADGSENDFAYLSAEDKPLRKKGNPQLLSLVCQPSGGKTSPVSADVSLKESKMGGVMKNNEDASKLGVMSQVSATDSITNFDLPSDLEKISLNELVPMDQTDDLILSPSAAPAVQATPGDPISTVQTFSASTVCPDAPVLGSTPWPRQSLGNGLDSPQQQGSNTSLSIVTRPPGIDAQTGRSLEPRPSPRPPQKRKAAEAPPVQGTPVKIPRANPAKQFPSRGVLTSIPQGFSEQSAFAGGAAASVDTIALQQRGSEGAGVPTFQEDVKTFACKTATKDKLKRTVISRVDQVPEINWDPRPSFELTPAEKARKDRQREKNKLSAQKTRQREKETIMYLEAEVQRLDEERRQLSDKIAAITKEMRANEVLLDSHRCVFRK